MNNSLFKFKASHMMLSTNPRLTTNVKLIVDSNNNLFLESFNANNELSKFKFKKFRVSPNSLYNKDLYNFYDKGKFPKEFAYDVFKSSDDSKVLNNFSYQYDNFYKYGTQRLVSKLYDEEASIFAPLWLNDYIPKYFIIFKADSPLYEQSDASFKNNILHKSTIIKTIDLTENSNIGNYIRNYQNQIKATSIEFSPEKEDMTYFNGIDYATGTITSTGKYIHSDYINTDKTIIEYDHYLTNQFQENGVIIANLLNLEFLFTDDTTKDYDINRYYGLYVDDITEGTFELDIDTMYQKKHTDRYQTITPDLITKPKKNFFIEGLDGTTIYGKDVESDIGLYKYDQIKDLQSFFFINDINKDFYLVDTKHRWGEGEVKLSNNYLNLNNFLDSTQARSFIDVDATTPDSKSHIILEVLNDIPNTMGIKFYDGTNLLLEIYADDSLTLFDQNDYDFYFTAEGKLKNIAKSIAIAINNMGRNSIEAYSKDNKVVISSVFLGSKFNSLRFEFENRGLDDSLFFNHFSNNNYFVGGADPKSNRYIINFDVIDIFNSKYVVLENGSLEKASIGYYIDDKIRLDTHGTIILKNIPKFSNGQLIIVDKTNISFGRFNIYPVKDFDNDFYSEDFIQDKELIYEKEYYESASPNSPDIELFYDENNLYELNNNETNEYSVNKENYNLDFAKVSKIVPYINKWVYKNGMNIRCEDYRLNNSKVFGIYNRTPSQIDKKQNLNSYTHEWYYLDGLPDYYDGKEDLATIFLNGGVNKDDFLNIDINNFDSTFIVNKLNDYILNENKYKFSIFEDASASDEAIAFFKGIKVIIKELEEENNNNLFVNYNIESLKFKTDYAKFNDYKFSTMLINDHSFNDDDYKITIIKNEKFKYVVLLITVNIDFVEKLDKTILYSLKNKYNDLNHYEDIKLRGTIDLESTIYAGGYYIIKGLFDKENIKTDFIDQINVDTEGKFFEIHFNYKGIDYKISDIFRVLTSDTLLARKFVSDDGTSISNLYSFPMIYPNKRDMAFLNYDPVNSTYGIVVKNGGFNSYKNLLDDLSFSNIQADVNKGNPRVDYITVLENGDLIENDFILNLVAPNLIAAPMYIENTPDPSKPINFNFVNIIGYRMKLKSNVEIAPLYKHHGSFVPKFKDVFRFIDPYVENNVFITNDYKNSVLELNKNLNTNISEVCDLKNIFYHKVNNKDYQILELENDANFKSLYPLINECAFDYRDLNIFKTNWGSDYYLNYLEKNLKEFLLLKGEKEQKNYFGSKYMKTPQLIQIEKDIPFSYNNTNTSIKIDLDVKSILTDYFMTNIVNLFTNDVFKQSYILNNLLSLYETSKINLYVKEYVNGGHINFDNMSLDDAEKQLNKLAVTYNYEMNKKNDLDFYITFQKIVGLSYSFGISIDITLI